MNRKTISRYALLALACAACCSAQGVADSSGPVAALRFIAQMLLAMFTFVCVVGLIWHCVQALLGDHDRFHRIAAWALFSGLGFGAYWIVTQLRAASITPF